MSKITKMKSLDYDDVYLIANKKTIVKSRKEIPFEPQRIVVSAMSMVQCEEFYKAIAKLPVNLRPTVHSVRDKFWKERLKWLWKYNIATFVGIGLNTPEIEKQAFKLGFNTVLVDIANGTVPQLKKKIPELKKKFEQVIVGSVSTPQTAKYLIDLGVDVIRTGLGTGQRCTTRNASGFSRGALTEIMEIYNGIDSINKNEKTILADGRIKSAGDIVKAFGAGASYVMTGRLFADADCSYGNLYAGGLYGGQTSEYVKKEFFPDLPLENIEGSCFKLNTPPIPLEQLMKEVWAGIHSGISYSGYKCISDFIGKGVFEIVHNKRN